MPPSLELSRCDVLAEARFNLVEARVDWGNGAQSAGWGRDPDPETAKWKAINEAVERYCYARLPDAVSSRAVDLDHAIDPSALVRYERRQYADPRFALKPFDRCEPRHWVRATPVLGGRQASVLADCVCSPRAFDPTYRARLVTHATTSGCASADSMETAILRATLELVERDAFMRHWFAQCPGHGIAASTLPLRFSERFARLASSGCTVGLAWLHHGAHATWLAWARHEALHFTSVGSASGLDGATALDTALNELETMALARIEGVEWHPIDPVSVRTPADHAALYATPGYFHRADALLCTTWPQRSFDEACAAFDATPDQFYERLARSGHAPHWVDLSVADARGAVDGKSIYAVRAVAPELIPMAFGWGHMPLGMDRWRRIDPDIFHPFS